MSKTSRYLQYSIIALAFALLFSPLILSNNLFFPFITGKAFYFRIVIEIMAALYIVLVCYDRSFLPKKSPIAYAVGGFLLIMAAATVFSVAPAKSFWSNFERMEGYITLIHLGILFLVVSSVVRSRRMWVYLIHATMGLSLIMGLLALSDLSGENAAALSGGRIQGTLGNSSYLGVYALIHIFLAMFFLFSHFARKNVVDMLPRLFGYALIIVFNVVVLFDTGTRGAVVGLGFGMLLIGFILAFGEKQVKKIRNIGIGILAVALAGVVFLGAVRGTEFAKAHPLIDRYSSLVTWDIMSVFKNQGYARGSLLWPMAWQGVTEKPLLGWGQDNFGYVFAKYYNPAAYAQEQWFDRTHNVFLDWLIAGGFLGLIGYLALFVAMLMVLWSKHPDMGKGHKWPLIERAIISGLVVAYFVHNFFVFDNLSSYILFFMLLSYFHERNVYAHSTVNPGLESEIEHRPFLPQDESRWFVSIVVVVALVFTIYNVNYKPYQNSANLIKALQSMGGHYNKDGEVVGADLNETLGYFKGIFDSNVTLGLAEARERLVEASAAVVTSTSTPIEIKKEFDTLTREQYSSQFERFPGDPRYHYFLALYLSRIGDFNGGIEQIKKAEELSPTKQQFIMQEGLTYFILKQYALSAATFKKAYELDTSYLEGRALYASALIYAGKSDEALKIIEGTEAESDGRVIQSFMQNGRFDIVEKWSKAEIAKDPNNAQLHVSLAALYVKAKRNADAIKELRAAIEVEPRFKDQGEQWIKMIQSGIDPTQ